MIACGRLAGAPQVHRNFNLVGTSNPIEVVAGLLPWSDPPGTTSPGDVARIT
jgi:hypothetical protein